MNKETIDEIIKRQGAYEITYKKDEGIKTHLISNIVYSPKYGNSCIEAYCHETCKELTFSISKIQSIQEYWIGILSKETIVPQTGLYLVVRAGLGQSIDIEYELHMLSEGDLFDNLENSWAEPIAYHYIPSFEMPEGKWIEMGITLRKWQFDKTLAPEKGLPIIAYKKSESVPVDYRIGIGDGYNAGCVVEKGKDVLSGFKDDSYFSGWSERWDGYKILGLLMVKEYDCYACHQHIEQRRKIEPNFLFD